MNYLISHYLFKHLSPVYNRFNSITCFQHSYTECLKKERIILGSWIQKWEWGVGGGALIFEGSHCWNFVVTIVSVTVHCPLFILLMYFYQGSHTKRRFSIIRQIDDWWEFACFVVMRPSLYWRGRGGGGTYVPSLNFKYSCSASLGVGHVPCSIEPIFMSFVANSSSHMSLFQGHVTCRNFALAGPH